MNVSRLLTGTYKCEVSAGSPSYHTLIARASMEVVSKCINHRELKTFYFHFLSGKINLPFSDCPQYTRVLFPFITAFDFKTAIHFVNTYEDQRLVLIPVLNEIDIAYKSETRKITTWCRLLIVKQNGEQQRRREIRRLDALAPVADSEHDGVVTQVFPLVRPRRRWRFARCRVSAVVQQSHVLNDIIIMP